MGVSTPSLLLFLPLETDHPPHFFHDCAGDRPLVVQLAGNDPSLLVQAALMVQDAQAGDNMRPSVSTGVCLVWESERGSCSVSLTIGLYHRSNAGANPLTRGAGRVKRAPLTKPSPV